MEYGYAVVIPTYVLLDHNLSPTERLLYGVLSASANGQGYCYATNADLCSATRYKVDGVLKQVSEVAMTRMLEKLESLGHIVVEQPEGSPRFIVVKYQKSSLSVKVGGAHQPRASEVTPATIVLDYLSQAHITRGYRDTPFKPTKTNLEAINARLADGHTVDDCKAVINVKFIDEYFVENIKYLTPQTLFRPTNFERYLTEAGKVKDIHNKIVTKRGLGPAKEKTTSEDVDGVAF